MKTASKPSHLLLSPTGEPLALAIRDHPALLGQDENPRVVVGPKEDPKATREDTYN